jgi:thiol-disulfide isomerase/thioredoxin
MSINLLNNRVPDNNTSETPLSLIKKGNVLVLYYADWCPHCITFKPTWDKFVNQVKTGKCKKSVSIVTIEHKQLQSAENSELAGEAEGFPTLKFYKKPNLKSPTLYQQERTIDALIEFVNKHGRSTPVSNLPVSKGKKGKKGVNNTKVVLLGGKKKRTLKKVGDETVKYTKKAVAKLRKELKKSKRISKKLIKDMKKEFKI